MPEVESLTVDFKIRGNHIYKDSWSNFIPEVLYFCRDVWSNHHPFAVVIDDLSVV